MHRAQAFNRLAAAALLAAFLCLFTATAGAQVWVAGWTGTMYAVRADGTVLAGGSGFLAPPSGQTIAGIAAAAGGWSENMLWVMSSGGQLGRTGVPVMSINWGFVNVFQATGRSPQPIVAFGSDGVIDLFAVAANGDAFRVNVAAPWDATYLGNIGPVPTGVSPRSWSQLKTRYR